MTVSNNDIHSALSVSGTTLGSAITSQIHTNPYGRGVKVIVNTLNASAGSFTVSIQGVMAGSAVTLLTSAAINATGLTTLTVYPGVAVSANVSASDVLPRQWQLVVTPTGFTGTANISACVIV